MIQDMLDRIKPMHVRIWQAIIALMLLLSGLFFVFYFEEIDVYVIIAQCFIFLLGIGMILLGNRIIDRNRAN